MTSEKYKKINTLHTTALLLGILALSLAPIFVRLSDTSSSSIAFWRMAIATPFLALAWWIFPAQVQKQKNPKLKDYFCLVMAGIMFAADLLAWNLSVEQTTVANATLFVNFASLFVALLSWLLLKQLPSKGLLIGMCVAIVGSILLIWPHFNYESSSLAGDGLGLLAGFFYGAYILSVQLVRPVFSTMTIMTITGVITASTSLMMSFLLDQPLSVGSNTGWLALWGQAIIVQMIGQSLLAFALVELPATLSSIALLLQPVLSAIIAAFLFDESLDTIQILGMGTILFGIAYVKLMDQRLRAGSNRISTGKTTINPDLPVA